MKHPQHILAISAAFTDSSTLKGGMGLVQGLNSVEDDEYEQWLDDARTHLVLMQREGLELNTSFRQILPYTVIAVMDQPKDDEAGDIGESPKYITYQRGKGIGEARLAGNYSIGFGGHIDLKDVIADDNSVIDLGQTIDYNISRETGVEEVEFFYLNSGEVITFETHPQEFSQHVLGFILDDANSVGQVHLGVVNMIIVGTHIGVRCKEEELITMPPMTASELQESDFAFENWTQILIEELSEDLEMYDAEGEDYTVGDAIFEGGEEDEQ